MSGYPRSMAVAGKSLKVGAMLGAAMLLVLIVGAGQSVQGQTFSVLHNFNLDNGDGGFSVAGLVRDQAGNLYGTTKNGGLFSQGAVFKIDTAGNESLLHSFSGPDGANPYGGLVLDSAGDLFGTTAFGGAFSLGTVFEIDTSGNETVLYSLKADLAGHSMRESYGLWSYFSTCHNNRLLTYLGVAGQFHEEESGTCVSSR